MNVVNSQDGLLLPSSGDTMILGTPLALIVRYSSYSLVCRRYNEIIGWKLEIS